MGRSKEKLKYDGRARGYERGGQVLAERVLPEHSILGSPRLAVTSHRVAGGYDSRAYFIVPGSLHFEWRKA